MDEKLVISLLFVAALAIFVISLLIVPAKAVQQGYEVYQTSGRSCNQPEIDHCIESCHLQGGGYVEGSCAPKNDGTLDCTCFWIPIPNECQLHNIPDCGVA